jgi:predicted permease
LSLRDAVVGETRRPLLLLLAAAGVVLLIACANVGNLLLARALARYPELAMRAALGASRRQLVAHVLTEGVGLAVVGAGAAVAIAWYAAPALAALVPEANVAPGLDTVGVGTRVLGFALVAAMLSAIGASAIAVTVFTQAERGAPLAHRHGTSSRPAALAASSLVVAEVALAVVLLAGSGLALRSFRNLLAVDPGFSTDSVLTVALSLPDGRYESEDARHAFFRRAFDEITALPAVETIGAAMVMPLTGNNWTVPLQRADHPLAPGERAPDVGWQLASRGYFEALRIPLRAGRLFSPTDASGPPVVIISEAVAARHFPGEDALGHRLDLGEEQAEIVGVVGDVRRGSLADTPRADLYFPFEKVAAPQTTLFVRVKGDPLAVLPAVQGVVRRVEPQAVLFETRTMAAIARESAAVTRLAMQLLTGFATVALLLAAVGVHGVMSYRVRRRSREIGTRLALGATTGHVTRLVLVQAARLAGLGLLAGAAVAFALARALASALYGVAPWDPLTLAATMGLLAAATLVAAYLPARVAARVAPASVLASE